jgi:hypothetical protein
VPLFVNLGRTHTGRLFPLFAVLAGVLLFVLLSAPVTVTLDGYSHLYGATALRWMLDGLPEARETFAYNSVFLPNWLSALALAALSSVLPHELALKLMVVSTGALFFAGLWFCIERGPYSPDQRVQILIILLPFALNAFVVLGYYGFLISASLCLFVLGLLLRHGLTMRAPLQLLSAALLVVAFAAHPFPVLVSLMFPWAYVFADALARRRAGSRLAGPALRRHVLGMWPWFVPALLVASFSLRLWMVGAPQADPTRADAMPRTFTFAREAMRSVSPGGYPAVFSMTLLLLLVVGIFARLRKASARVKDQGARLESPAASPSQPITSSQGSSPDSLRFATLAVLAVVTLALSVIAPDRVGDGSEIVMRLLFHAAVFLILLAFADATPRPRFLALCSALAVVWVITFSREYHVAARRLAPAVAELRSAMSAIPARSRILILSHRMTPLCEGGPFLKRTFPERHAALAGAIDNELIVLNDYQAHTSHFPLVHRNRRHGDVVDEFDSFSARQREGWMDILSGDDDVDFVVAWGLSGDPLCRTTVRAPYEYMLRSAYERVRLEEGFSRVTVWRRRSRAVARPRRLARDRQARCGRRRDAAPDVLEE